MPRKGRDLEKLVATLESLIGGASIKLTSPDYITGIKSHGRREIDVSLRSRAGTSEVLVIFECRKRKPKDDVTWIEQLAAKGTDVRASKVVAVSSSGFSAAARTLANHEAIELRSVESITIVELANWFPFAGFAVIVEHAPLWQVDIFGDCPDDQDPERFIKALDEALSQSESTDAILIRAQDGKAVTMTDAWDEILDRNPQIMHKFEPGGEQKAGFLTVEYEGPKNPAEPKRRYYVQTNIGPVYIARIVFYALFYVDAPRDLMPEPSQYSREDGARISQTLRYRADISNRHMEFGVHKVDERPNMLFLTFSAESGPREEEERQIDT